MNKDAGLVELKREDLLLVKSIFDSECHIAKMLQDALKQMLRITKEDAKKMELMGL